MGHGDDHPHDGLTADLKALAAQSSRRKVLGWLAGATLLPLLGCEDANGGACAAIPEETAGPYPGDGTNGANALVLDGIVRSDIRSSIAGLSGTAEGIPLTVTLTVVDSGDACAALAGYVVYLWHCDRDGQYSMYTRQDQNYLRGVLETAEDGTVTFTTIFPGCYDGRMPHMHFEVYEDLASATSGRNAIATSQLAFPTAVCDAVYATTGYEASVTNFARTSFERDNVFSDGVEQQLAEVAGTVSDGYSATLTIGV
ncbi:intradiol ring-cleavage dioxygenase [Chondromyces crocatus]|uniref:Intradiol ring-cleavage dioxygenases domain-containing protein n=1 Tax=Chondromyces crocatus TaxID=52 RepID=A0A0K1EP89_CHOCO|nr:intradiol ring-cleavage dioxygenase [Chondromyces crocatus]AKT42438.1 uncharacterized protein CMC5_066640 [Chondromyces crocatus]